MFKYSFVISNFLNDADAPALKLNLTYSEIEKLNPTIEIKNQAGLDAKKVLVPENKKFWESRAWFLGTVAFSLWGLFMYFYSKSDRWLLEQINLNLEYSGEERKRWLAQKILDAVEKYGVLDNAPREPHRSI